MASTSCKLCGAEISKTTSPDPWWCRSCLRLRYGWRDLVLGHKETALAWLREQAANLGFALERTDTMYVLIKAAGEVCAATEALPTINAATVKERYDALWAAEAKLAEALARVSKETLP